MTIAGNPIIVPIDPFCCNPLLPLLKTISFKNSFWLYYDKYNKGIPKETIVTATPFPASEASPRGQGHNVVLETF